jgi:hypothetical protein
MPVRWAGSGRMGSGGRLLSAAGEVLGGLMLRNSPSQPRFLL